MNFFTKKYRVSSIRCAMLKKDAPYFFSYESFFRLLHHIFRKKNFITKSIDLMPIFDYHCNDCETTYEIFHTVREVKEDVVCPSCNSTHFKKLFSAPNVSVGHSAQKFSAPVCDSGGCCGGGMCNIN